MEKVLVNDFPTLIAQVFILKRSYKVNQAKAGRFNVKTTGLGLVRQLSSIFCTSQTTATATRLQVCRLYTQNANKCLLIFQIPNFKTILILFLPQSFSSPSCALHNSFSVISSRQQQSFILVFVFLLSVFSLTFLQGSPEKALIFLLTLCYFVSCFYGSVFSSYFFLFFLFLETGLTMQIWLALNALCSLGWP